MHLHRLQVKRTKYLKKRKLINSLIRNFILLATLMHGIGTRAMIKDINNLSRLHRAISRKNRFSNGAYAIYCLPVDQSILFDRFHTPLTSKQDEKRSRTISFTVNAWSNKDSNVPLAIFFYCSFHEKTSNKKKCTREL